MNDFVEMEVEVFEEIGNGTQKPETSRYFVDFSEMTTEGLREEFCRMKGELVTLANFLTANFGRERHYGEGVPGPSSVETAIRLLGELRERKQQVDDLSVRLFEASSKYIGRRT